MEPQNRPNRCKQKIETDVGGLINSYLLKPYQLHEPHSNKKLAYFSLINSHLMTRGGRSGVQAEQSLLQFLLRMV